MKVRFAVAPHAASLLGQLKPFGDAVEAGGFDGVWLSDLPASPAPDPLVALAVLAGRTERMRLGANVVPLGHNPFLLAKALAQLDHLSGGRLLLSFVTGLRQPGERDVLGLDGTGRGELLEESLRLLRAWWDGETVTHHSPRLHFDAVASPGRPRQTPLEIWLGGRAPAALDRAGRVADGWLGAMVTPAESAGTRDRIQDAAARAGRELDPEHFGMSIAYSRTPPAETVLAEHSRRRGDVDPRELVPVGAEGLRAMLAGYIEGGLSKFVIRPAGTVDSWDEELGWLGEAILDLQT